MPPLIYNYDFNNNEKYPHFDENEHFKLMNVSEILTDLKTYENRFDTYLYSLHQYIKRYVSNYVNNDIKKYGNIYGENKKSYHADEFTDFFEDVYKKIYSILYNSIFSICVMPELTKIEIIKIYNTVVSNTSKLLFCYLKWYGLRTMNINTHKYANVGNSIYRELVESSTTDAEIDRINYINSMVNFKDIIIVDCKEGPQSYTCGRGFTYFKDIKNIHHILIYNTISEENDLMDYKYEPIARQKYNDKIKQNDAIAKQKYLKYKQKYLNLKKKMN